MRSNLFTVLMALLLLVVLSCSTLAAYQESPMLAERVASGELPPVGERLPENPYVVDPVDRIGDYGGTIRLLTLYATAPLGVAFISDSLNGFVNPLPDGSDVRPHFVEGIDVSDDYTTFTFHLMKGTRWSDGHPFTADDILFWYNDYLLNEDLVPTIASYWRTGGEVVQVSKIDDFTVEFRFTEPQPLFLRMPFSKAPQRDRLFLPKHFLMNYHPNYVPMEELEKMVAEEGLDHWYQLFRNKMQGYIGVSAVVGVPVLTPYVPIVYTSTRRVFERNPYYWKVDTAGNQLPYIDRVEVEVVGDAEVATAMMISGEIDFDGFSTNIVNYPMYRQYEEEGNYRTVLWRSGNGTEVFFYFNLTHEDEAKRDIFRNVDFRRAMSLGIDRQEINEMLYFGQADVRQFTVLSSSRYFEPEFAEAYIDYDPEAAMAMLDSIGLVDQNGDGWRQLPDGDEFSFTIEFTTAENPLKLDIVELTVEYWKELGIDVSSRQISGELYGIRQGGNLLECSIWHGGWSTDITFPAANPWVGAGGNYPWPAFVDYWMRGGELDQDVPEDIQNLWDWYEEVRGIVDEEEHIAMAKKILASQAENLWLIGTIGTAPHALIVSNALRNVPEDGLWTWDTQWSMSIDPEQFFLDQSLR